MGVGREGEGRRRRAGDYGKGEEKWEEKWRRHRGMVGRGEGGIGDWVREG